MAESAFDAELVYRTNQCNWILAYFWNKSCGQYLYLYFFNFISSWLRRFPLNSFFWHALIVTPLCEYCVRGVSHHHQSFREIPFDLNVDNRMCFYTRMHTHINLTPLSTECHRFLLAWLFRLVFWFHKCNSVEFSASWWWETVTTIRFCYLYIFKS